MIREVPKPEPAPAEDQLRTELPVLGMNCANCTGAVQGTLERAGAVDVEVSLATESVSFRPVAEGELERLAGAVSDAGYQMILPIEGAGVDHVSEERARIQERERRQLIWGAPVRGSSHHAQYGC